MRLLSLLFLCFQVNAATLNLDNVKIIQPKANEIKIKKVRKSFHGKKIVTEQTKLISTKPTDGNKALQKYIQAILKQLNENLMKKLPKDHGSILFRFQVQQSGYFDFLNARGSNLKAVNIINTYFSNLESFPEIPSETGQKELQLEFSLEQ